MKNYICDFCQIVIGGKPEVILSGKIVMDGPLIHQKHFCNASCFWKWVKYNMQNFTRDYKEE